MSPSNLLLVALALSLALAPDASAQEPSSLREGPFDPVTVQAAKDGAAVRAEPGFLFKKLRSLELAERVRVNGRKGDWLRLRAGGWVSLSDVADATKSLPGESSAMGLRVTSDGVRLRSGPGTGHDVVGRRGSGDRVTGVQRQGDWWELAEGGWVFASLVEEVGPVDAPMPAGASTSAARPPEGTPVRRWSYMDLNGTLFEIFEVDKKARFLAGLRQAMRETGVLEDDWTYLRLVISVQEGQSSFHYSPSQRGNPVSVMSQVGEELKRFGSVFVQGPVERIPMHLRGFFQGQAVHAGERFEGLLMFRPTLDPAQIQGIQMRISGRTRTFLESE